MPRLFFRNRNLQHTRAAKQETRLEKFLRRVIVRGTLRRLQAGMAIGLSTGLLVTSAILFGGLRQFESRSADFFYRPAQPSGQVVLVAVDDETVEKIGWPIERPLYGAFLFALMRAEPRVIALNFVLSDPRDKEEDDFVAMILLRAGPVVQPVLGIETTRSPTVSGSFPAFDAFLKPAPALLTTNTTLAHAMIYPDSDGVVRRIPLAINVQRQQYSAFGLAALALYQGRDPKVELQNNQVVFGDVRVPVDENGQMLINYVRHAVLPTVSFADIAQGKADFALLRDKIVLVGPMTKAVHERYAVPLTVSDSSAYNLEIQADVIETLLSGNFLRQQDPLTQIGEVLIIAGIAGMTLPHLPWLYAAALTITYSAAYLLYAFRLADEGTIVTPLYVALALVLTYALTMLYRYFSEERTRAFIGRIFLGMMPSEATSQVLALFDRGVLSLHGRRREVTILYLRLQGLSALSESLAPEAAMEVINRYASLIVEAVFRCGGSVLHQAGDTIIAMWNFPLAQLDHASRAVNAALEIQNAIPRLDPQFPAGQIARVSIGIATGPAVAGYLSASAGSSYSVIGDVVDVAERLSTLALDTPIRLDTATCDLVSADFETRAIHSFRIRGKQDPIQVWEVQQKAELKEVAS